MAADSGKKFGHLAPSLAAVGSVLGAAGASACCWAPLVLLGFGFAAGGASAVLESARPYLLAAAGVFAGGLLHGAMSRPVSGGACPSGARARLRKWAAAIVSLMALAGAAASPDFMAASAFSRTTPMPDANPNETHVQFAVHGMTCPGCAVALEKSLRRIPGVISAHVDYKQGVAEIHHASSPSDAAEVSGDVEKTIEASGFGRRPMRPR